METSKLKFKHVKYILNSLALLVFIGAGIVLFFLREEKVSENTIHKIKIKIKPDKIKHSIIKNEFLIQTRPKHIKSVLNLLNSLNLEIKSTILNWILVGEKGAKGPPTVPYDSEEALGSQLRLTALLKNDEVLDAHHNYVLESFVLPKYKSFHRDWQMQVRNKKKPLGMNLPLAWEITQGSHEITIAVIDDFFYDGKFTFKERFSSCMERVNIIKPNIIKQQNSKDVVPHGEVMLLALGACSNTSAYNAGIDWQASLLAAQRSQKGHAQSFIAALKAAGINACNKNFMPCNKNKGKQKKADIILLPFGNAAPDLLQFTSDMVTELNRKNIIVVTAAGNSKEKASNIFPGGAPGVINVGSTNKLGYRSYFSNWGETIDVLAPGEDIELIYPSGPKSFSGTSISAAYVAQSISLIKSIIPNINHKKALYYLQNTAYKLDCERYCRKKLFNSINIECQEECCEYNKLCGSLSIDVNRAVRLAQNKKIKSPLIDLDSYYKLFLRNFSLPKKVKIRNLSDLDITVETITYDKDISITPQKFRLSRQGAKNSKKIVEIFLKEPVKRTNYKIDFMAKTQSRDSVDFAELYIEYIPRD